MQNRRRGGKRLLKKEPLITKKSFRRGVSLLLSVSMVMSMLVGVISFPAFAREIGSDDSQTEPQVETVEETAEETTNEIKARLMWQIRYEGWDPYSESMSMDEFYALMELFREGSLPLDPITEAIDPETANPVGDVPDAEQPGAEQPGTEQPGTEEPGTEEQPGTGAQQPALPGGEGPGIEPPHADGTYVLAPDTAAPSIIGPSAPTNADDAGIEEPAPDTASYIPWDIFLVSKPSGELTPPEGWPGLLLDEGDDGVETVITDPTINIDNPHVAGEVKQELFPEYDNLYVRRVTVQNTNVELEILGIVEHPYTHELIYYYKTSESQSMQVSATTLAAGQKFVIQYLPMEYAISYQIRFRAKKGEEYTDEKTRFQLFGYWMERTEDSEYYDNYQDYFEHEYLPTHTTPEKTPEMGEGIAEWVRQLPRLVNEADRDKLATDIFGDAFPRGTDGGRYAFTASAPAGYTLAFYMASDMDGEGTWIHGTAQLVTAEGYNGGPGEYKSVNQGWALGVEPIYWYTKTGSGNKMMPDEKNGPRELVTSGTFANNNVTADRIVVAVLRKKDPPQFDAYKLFKGLGLNSDGTGTTTTTNANVHGRGTSAIQTVTAKLKNRATGKEESDIPYDYEDEYLFREYYVKLSSSEFDKLDDSLKCKYIGYNNSNPIGNIQTADGWGWNAPAGETFLYNMREKGMNPDPNDSNAYTYQWTWQTNNGDNGYTLDTLEINRTGIAIPFHPKYKATDAFNEIVGDNSGGPTSWWTETTLPDGAVVKVEYLVLFKGNNGAPQRVYRITVTGAANNITVTNMNLMMGRGAKEFAIYDLVGVTVDPKTEDNDLRRTAVQFYDKNDYGWTHDLARGEVYVYEGPHGTDFGKADEKHGGANLRFMLQDGYSTPAYLLETPNGRVITHADEYLKNNIPMTQASIERGDDMSLDRSSQYPVVPYISNDNAPYMRYYDELTTRVDGKLIDISEEELEELKSRKNPINESFSNDDPIPVDKNGHLMYYMDGSEAKIFTDWSILRIYEDDSLAPTLYGSKADALSGNEELALTKENVILKEGCVFQKELEKIKEDKEGQSQTRHNRPNIEGMPVLRSQYIYSGEDGWYYIRLTGHEDGGDEKFGLLTVVAFPTRYIVRYMPRDIPEITLNNGTVIEAHPPLGMPRLEHYDSCPTFKQPDNSKKEFNTQFDDNDGLFYDVVTYNEVAVNYAKPRDKDDGYFTFVDWLLVNENNEPVKVKDIHGETVEVHIPASGSFLISDYAEHGIFNSDLGAIDDDIYVLRLMPTWDQMDKPYHYKVALRWVDAQGVLNEEYFDDAIEGSLWDPILTDYEQTENSPGPAVKILTNAGPFQDWIARHPTYTFWNPVNNAVDGEDYDSYATWHSEEGGYKTHLPSEWSAREKVMDALDQYFPKLEENATPQEQNEWKERYQTALKAIMDFDRDEDKIDDFERLGNYAYVVTQDKGTIVVWMYEDKGGLVFHKSADAEPFTTDEEFYFTVRQVMVGEDQAEPLNNTYKAYPETVYDVHTGQPRYVKDSDAWLVTFEDGNITSIVKNDGSNVSTKYFTLKSGEGIQLYVPRGQYTITELGSKSGGTYRTEVTYVAAETYSDEADPDKVIQKGMEQVPKPGWVFPTDYQWLKGNETTYQGRQEDPNDPNDTISQVSATVKFEVGANDVAHIINFSNQTSAVSLENLVLGPYQGEQLGYTVDLILPDGVYPLKDENGEYYFNFNLYSVTYPEGQKAQYEDQYNARKRKEGEPPPEPWKSKDDPEYSNWLTDPGSNGYAAWLKSNAYVEWWNWHNWRPDGTLSGGISGRLQMKGPIEDGSGGNIWSAEKVLILTRDQYGNATWTDSATYKGTTGTGVIGLTSGQRFYVVCSVLESGADINYNIKESDTRGYAPGGGRPREREGKARAAELSYELFINTKLAGLPRTGGMGTGVFYLAGLVFLTSGLGLAWINLEERRRAMAWLSLPMKRRWGK